jgi:hypothetical protein
MAEQDSPIRPNWRPEWRLPKKRCARARGAVADPGPLPSPDELRDEALRNLRAVATDPDASAVARVAANRALLEAAEFEASRKREEISKVPTEELEDAILRSADEIRERRATGALLPRAWLDAPQHDAPSGHTPSGV